MSKMGNFHSNFALLDVKRGRKALARRLAKGERVAVIIYGEIEGVWGSDDGVSQEFSVYVRTVEEQYHG